RGRSSGCSFRGGGRGTVPTHHRLDHGGDVVDGGGRQDPVAGADHVPVGSARPFQHVSGGGGDGGRVGEEDGRVEVALDRVAAAQTPPGFVDGQAPVDSVGGGADLGHHLQQVGGGRSEVDGGHVEVGQGGAGGGYDVAAVHIHRQGARPAVEQLDDIGARLHLHPQITAGRFGQPAERGVHAGRVEGAPELREVAGSGSFEEEGQHRRRPSGEADHGHVRDRKSTRLNSSHVKISYAVFCLK